MSALTREQVADALDLVWGDFVADTGCFPDCIYVLVGPTSGKHAVQLGAAFGTGNFAQSVTDILNARLSEQDSARTASRPEDGGS